MKCLVAFTVLAILPACASMRESVGLHHPDASTSRAQFELIKSLEGEWSGTMEGMGETQPVQVRYRVTANGTAVEETLAPGTAHEMITMYHLDGVRLMLTHYCSAGNQPRMVATNWEVDTQPHMVRFAFDGATNLASSKTGHMHEMTLTVDAPDKIHSIWTYYLDGVPGHEANIQLTRKGGAKVSRAVTSFTETTFVVF